MSCTDVFDDGAYGLSILASIRVLYERFAVNCRPGTWRVVICWADADNYDAVVDDFGNLVRVR